jgi:hypothetical protein
VRERSDSLLRAARRIGELETTYDSEEEGNAVDIGLGGVLGYKWHEPTEEDDDVDVKQRLDTQEDDDWGEEAEAWLKVLRRTERRMDVWSGGSGSGGIGAPTTVRNARVPKNIMEMHEEDRKFQRILDMASGIGTGSTEVTPRKPASAPMKGKIQQQHVQPQPMSKKELDVEIDNELLAERSEERSVDEGDDEGDEDAASMEGDDVDDAEMEDEDGDGDTVMD